MDPGRTSAEVFASAGTIAQESSVAVVGTVSEKPKQKGVYELQAKELKLQLSKQDTYPQREAVLFALRELTGEDLGRSSSDWQRFLLGPWLGHEL